MNNRAGNKRAEQTKQEGDKTPAAEWFVAALGLALVVTVVGFLLYQALAVKVTPPDITFAVEETRKVQQGYLVTITAHNGGGETVADLTVTGELTDGEEVLEGDTATLDYVPAHSTRQVGFYFQENPADHELVLRAGGYQNP